MRSVALHLLGSVCIFPLGEATAIFSVLNSEADPMSELKSSILKMLDSALTLIFKLLLMLLFLLHTNEGFKPYASAFVKQHKW